MILLGGTKSINITHDLSPQEFMSKLTGIPQGLIKTDIA